MTTFSLQKALASESYAQKCWQDYYYGGNTMKIDADSIEKINNNYKGIIQNWKAESSEDENVYETSDSDFNPDNYNINTGKSKVRAGLDAAAGVAGLAMGSVAKNVGKKAFDKTISKAASNWVNGDLFQNNALRCAQEAKATTIDCMQSMGEEGCKRWNLLKDGENFDDCVNRMAEENYQSTYQEHMENGYSEQKNAYSQDSDAQDRSWMISAPLALATGTMYMADKPNKDEKEACDDLKDEMNIYQQNLTAIQSDMGDINEAVKASTQEAQEISEQNSEEIQDTQDEYETYKETYFALKAKIDAGETLSEADKQKYNEAIEYMGSIGVDINTLTDEASENISDINNENAEHQSNLEDAADTVQTVQETTDFAESFDESTRLMCFVEAASQTTNVVSGAKAARDSARFASAFGSASAWAYAFTAMATAGAGMSGTGVVEQTSWGISVGKEIDARKDIQSLNAQTADIVSESTENFEAATEDLETITEEVEETTPEKDIPTETKEEPETKEPEDDKKD